MSHRFEERYRSGDTPWDHGTPDSNLIDTVTGWPVPACSVLEIGCGTGDNAIWLAGQGFKVTGCDIAETAIQTARTKASEQRADCSFLVTDFLKTRIPGAPFDFAFDRGCLHTCHSGREHRRFAGCVASHLGPGGLWLTLTGNADEPKRNPGPPQLTARKLAAAVEPFFEILSLQSGAFGSGQEQPPLAWIALMRKRP